MLRHVGFKLFLLNSARLLSNKRALFNEVRVIVEAPLFPLLMLSELGDADGEKSAGDVAEPRYACGV